MRAPSAIPVGGQTGEMLAIEANRSPSRAAA
jgi:hypothetical protein